MNKIIISSFCVLFVVAQTGWSQETVTDTPQWIEPAATGDVSSTTPEPADPSMSMEQNQIQEQQAAAIGVDTNLRTNEEGQYYREHVVNNPQGVMTQTWERVNNGEGYQYNHNQVWVNPDGTTLRQHTHTMSGTDPNNYTRQHTVILRDGRTISQTQIRTWDGTTGTKERLFIGPNGQTRQAQQSWTPDAQTSGLLSETPDMAQPSVDMSPISSPVAKSKEDVSWWQKLNPFRDSGGELSETTAAPRRGFTIGTAHANSAGKSFQKSGDHPSIRGSQNSHRPAWAGTPQRTLSRQGPPAHAKGLSTTSRPNPGRGPKR